MKNKKLFLLLVLTLFLLPLSKVDAYSTKDYYCQEAGFVVMKNSKGNYGCCPNGYSFGIDGKCVTQTSSGICPKGTTKDYATYCYRSSTTAKMKSEACFACGGSSQGVGQYVWGILYSNSQCSLQDSISKSKCHNPLTAYFEDALTYTIKTQCFYKESDGKCLAPVPTAPTKSGYTFNGWSKNCGTTESYYKQVWVYANKTTANNTFHACFTLNKQISNQNEEEKEEVTSQPGETTENNCKSGNTEKIQTINYYKITYNTGEGKFIDGSTTRVEYVKSNAAVGEFKVAPIKEGYIFTGWKDTSGNKFDSETKATSDITLTATYGEYEDEGYYCEDDSYIFNPKDTSCYKYLKFNSEGKADNVYYVPYNSNDNPTLGTAYNYTTKSYGAKTRFCYGNNVPADGDKGGIFFATGATPTITGKNNATYYFKENDKFVKYEDQDYWRSEDTCLIGSECDKNACIGESSEESNYGTCKYTFSAMIYHRINAQLSKDLTEDDVLQEDDEGKIKKSYDKTDEELTSNSKTGNVLIIIAWVVGLGALLYIVYYIRKKNGHDDIESLKKHFQKKKKENK